jgi:hypothetical protein
MNKSVRLLFAVLTVLTLMVLLFGIGWGIAVKIPIMVIVCTLISLGCVPFIYNDFKYFFGKK